MIEKSKCKNCGHQIEKMKKSYFIKKYKDGNLWCHVRHRWWKFNPSRTCFCGCPKPEPSQNRGLKNE